MWTEGDIIVFTGASMMIAGSVIFIRWARPALDLVIALGRAFSSTFDRRGSDKPVTTDNKEVPLWMTPDF